MASTENGADQMPAQGSREERAPVAQWLGLILAPLAFAVHLQIGYVLVPWSCITNGDVWIHVVGIGSLVLGLIGTWAAWLAWRAAGHVEPGEGGGTLPRTRFMGAVGVGTSAIISLVLFGQWIAAFFISSCQ